MLLLVLDYIKILPERGLYHPIVAPSDVWLLEKNFVLLNETLADQPLNLTISFNTVNLMWWSLQAQLMDLWSSKTKKIETTATTSTNSLFNTKQFFQPVDRREMFMLKRIFLDTNLYILAFSAAFMLLHSLFSFLAFKNEITFWQSNKSMEGLSTLSVIFNFVCELIVALYLYDSNQTSFLILLEIFIGVGKLSKTTIFLEHHLIADIFLNIFFC